MESHARASMLVRVVVWVGLLMIGVVSSVEATLIDRGYFDDGMGGQVKLIYDDDLDITWLGDANLGAGSKFENPQLPNGGYMTWENAMAWSADLSVGGFRNWRLPKAPRLDLTCSGQTNDVPSFGVGQGCMGSELGHLVNVEDINSANAGFFINVGGHYWSDLEWRAHSAFAM